MQKRWTLPMIAFAALVAGSGPVIAQDQNNTPTDPTAPGGGTCTGFPGDPASCPRQDPQNAIIPEQPDEPDINTQSGPQPDDDGTLEQPSGASPENGTANPTPQ